MLYLCEPMLFIGQQKYNTECHYFNILLRKIFSSQKKTTKNNGLLTMIKNKK